MPKRRGPRLAGTSHRADFQGTYVPAGNYSREHLALLDAVGVAMAAWDDCGCDEHRQAVLKALEECDDGRGVRCVPR